MEFTLTDEQLAVSEAAGGLSDRDRAGNGNTGVWIYSAATQNNLVAGNYIGLSKNGAVLRNGGDGVLLFTRAHSLGWHHQQLVHERPRADVELRAVYLDTVGVPVDDPQVKVWIILF